MIPFLEFSHARFHIGLGADDARLALAGLRPVGGRSTDAEETTRKRAGTMTDSPASPEEYDARIDAVSIGRALDRLDEFWSQRIVGEANGTLLKIAKGTGSTRWHSHDDQDETFLVMDGELVVQLRDRDVTLGPGDLFIVPRGVEHCPVAPDEARFVILGTSVTSNAAGGKPEWSYGRASDPR